MEELIQKMWLIYTMEYYSAIKNEDILRQMDGTRKYHPKLGNLHPKWHAWYVLTNKWILAKNVQNTQDKIDRSQKVKSPRA